jgi:hypothetical protein
MDRPPLQNRLKAFALRQGPLLLPIGLALLMVAGLLANRSAPRDR